MAYVNAIMTGAVRANGCQTCILLGLNLRDIPNGSWIGDYSTETFTEREY